MTSVKAYYDGSVFVPVEPVDIAKDEVIWLHVIDGGAAVSEQEKRLAAFARLTESVERLNREEPLSPEYDLILSQRPSFEREIEL